MLDNPNTSLIVFVLCFADNMTLLPFGLFAFVGRHMMICSCDEGSLSIYICHSLLLSFACFGVSVGVVLS